MDTLRVIQNSRPDEIILAYWREVLSIEEDAVLFKPEYLEDQYLYFYNKK